MGKNTEKAKGIWQDFKAFIARGNVVDMAIGVIMGSAFGAIVTALVNILMSLCTWGIPGGISSLVTVLPALNPGQIHPNGAEFNIITAKEFLDLGDVTQQALYVQHGANYYYKSLAIIDWGTFINAIISFLIIAITLFAILKIYTTLVKKSKEFEQKIVDNYLKKHPKEEAKTEAAPEETK